jgi:acetyl-CoA carboxylase alpha subunit
VAAAGVIPPEGEVTILFSDITRAASLWEFNAAAMKEATLLHNQLLRSLLKEHQVRLTTTTFLQHSSLSLARSLACAACAVFC